MNLTRRLEERMSPVMSILAPINGLPDMFARCFLNTLESTAYRMNDGGVYVITGDIEAMWLRDSTEQVLHYLRFAQEDEEVATWIEQLIQQQVRCVCIDPYANAFNIGPNGRHGYEDLPKASAWVWERKYELDSLCHVLLLALRYSETTGRTAFMDETFFQAAEKILDVIQTEQNHERDSDYRFQRFACPASDTLEREGLGTPVAYTGMSWSGFRPSDDACEYGYFIPANLFAKVMLEQFAPLAEKMGRTELGTLAREIAEQIRYGIERFGIVKTEQFGEIYAYEVDGLGHYKLMDDANIPSLLSLPYLGICEADDLLYKRTRAFVLSCKNPYFFNGKAAKGIGSPHTPTNSIWPIALCVQGLTAIEREERVETLRLLLTTHANTARMHESFNKDDPSIFTRSWFAWANSMLGELIMQMYEKGELKEAVQALLSKGINDIKTT